MNYRRGVDRVISVIVQMPLTVNIPRINFLSALTTNYTKSPLDHYRRLLESEKHLTILLACQ